MKKINLDPKRRLFATGKTQSGKSWLIKSMLKQVRNYIIIDVKGEYSSFGVVVNSVSGLIEALKSGCVRIVVQFLAVDFGRKREIFNDVCGVVSRLKNILLVVDEGHLFADLHSIPANFEYIITTKEAHNVGVWYITQRSQKSNPDVRGNSSYKICFRLNEDLDINALSNFKAVDIRSLGEFEFLFYDDSRLSEAVSKHRSV